MAMIHITTEAHKGLRLLAIQKGKGIGELGSQIISREVKKSESRKKKP